MAMIRRMSATGASVISELIVLTTAVIAGLLTLYWLGAHGITSAMVVRWLKPTGTVAQILMPLLIGAIGALAATPAGIAAYLAHHGHRHARIVSMLAVFCSLLLGLYQPWWLLTSIPAVIGWLLLLRQPKTQPTSEPIPDSILASPPEPGSVKYGPLERYQESHHA